MQYGGYEGADDAAQSRTAFREAEKKYQLSRERKMKMKRGKRKPGKLVTRPIDTSDVLDLHLGSGDPLPSEVLRHQVLGYEGPVYTFARHPGLVYMPGALPPEQQLELTMASLTDYPEPPARTNHVLQYGPMTGLWYAAQQGLRLNWDRKDDPHAGSRAEDRRCGSDGKELRKGCGSAGVAAAGVATDDGCEAGSRAVADDDDDDDGCRSSSSVGSDGGGGHSRRSSGSGSGSDCCVGAVEGAPTFEECWSADGLGPPAEKLLRKLRWATLGPQFKWTERQYDFASVYRRLPPSLEALAKQLAAVVDQLQVAGLQVMPPAAPSGGYQPDAAIVNYYQQGDVLGGHLDDVERDMAQPIVSVSLGCPAIFLMGGPSKEVLPSALLLRGGDVLVLAGEARCCYHGVPRILEPELCGAFGAEKPTSRTVGPVDTYIGSARINISIRAVA